MSTEKNRSTFDHQLLLFSKTENPLKCITGTVEKTFSNFLEEFGGIDWRINIEKFRFNYRKNLEQ